MSRMMLLRVAALLTLFTFTGHTFGALSKPPVEAAELVKTYDLMAQTFVSFPVGSPTSIASILFGANIGLSVFFAFKRSYFSFNC